MVRSSDQSVLGVVSTAYKPWQNAEAFAWAQPLVDDGTLQLESSSDQQVVAKVVEETDLSASGATATQAKVRVV